MNGTGHGGEVSSGRDIGREYPEREVLHTCGGVKVYRSADPRTGERVVVKVFDSGESSRTHSQLHRFSRMMRAIQGIAARGLPAVFDFGIDDHDRAFVVMEPVAGQPLGEFQGLSPGRTARILARVADTLEELARKGVYHHNLRPDNIIVIQDPMGDDVRLLGIGSACFADAGRGLSGEQTGAEGELGYIPPERLNACAENSIEGWRSDLYSLAVIAAEALGAEVRHATSDRPVVSLPDHVRRELSLGDRLERVLEAALQADPRQRRIGWADLHDALGTPDDAAPVVGGTVQIPLDRLPKLKLEVHPPVATDDRYEVDEGVSLEVPAPGVLANDSDPEGRELIALPVGEPGQGSLELREDGGFRYQPAPGFVGRDTFTYRVSNGVSDSSVATVSIDVRKVERPPIAVDDSYAVDEGEALEVPAPGVLTNDSDPEGRELAAIAVGEPGHGSVELRADGGFRYRPAPGFVGRDTFTYRVSNGMTDSSVATVSIDVREVVSPPVAADDLYETNEGEALDVPSPGVLANDTERRGRPLTAIMASGPSHGRLDLRSDGSFTYEPEPGFSGHDRFSYGATSGLADSEPATVTVTVKAVERVPVADEFATDRHAAVDVSSLEEVPSISKALEAPEAPAESREPEPPEPPPSPPPLQVQPPSQPPPPPPLRPSRPPPESAEPPESHVEPPPLRHRQPPELVPPPLPVSEASKTPRRLPVGIIAGALVVLALVVVVVMILAVRSGGPAVSEDETPVLEPTPIPTARPLPTLAPAVDPRLERAQVAVADGNLDLARSELDGLTGLDVQALTDDERMLYEELAASLTGELRDQVVKDIRGGLEWGSVKMLNRGIAALSSLGSDEIAAVPGLAADVERGRAALRANEAMLESRSSGDSVALLESATEVHRMLPKYSAASKLREEAATAVEAEAAARAQEGDYIGALAMLEPLSRLWPEREGLVERVDGYRLREQESRERERGRAEYQEFLGEVARMGESGDPEGALALLASRAAPRGLEGRRDETRSELERRLAELDAAAPEIALVPGTELELKKNTPAVIVVTISDDYRVVTAVALARRSGAPAYREVALSGPDGDRYTLEVGPELHGNEAVELYIEARDRSGHVGRLGSPSEPLVLERQGFLKRVNPFKK